jgi:prepilin-type N-terminal cleavage/methylation domain-containing protein
LRFQQPWVGLLFMPRRGFTLVETILAIAIVALLVTLVTVAAKQALRSSSLATSANNIRQLAAGAAAYLGDNNYTFWKYRQNANTLALVQQLGVPERGVIWWFGFETLKSMNSGEGNRRFDPDLGPLAGYVPGGFLPDPSLAFTGKALKPKYQFGYIGVGYNIHLGGGWMGGNPLRYFELEKPHETVVFATSAQVNTFQSPASPNNPMIEDFYGFDDGATGNQPSIHFRHNGKAMVAYATGNAGFLEMDKSTLDMRAPEAKIGRFAPMGSSKFLR